MQNKNFFSLFVALFLLTNCKKEVVGGKCEYTSVERNMIVTFIDGNLNEEFMISFQQKNSEGDDVYRLGNKEFKNVFRNFDIKEFNNKNSTYLMTFEEITQGSCVPFVIKKIQLIQ